MPSSTSGTSRGWVMPAQLNVMTLIPEAGELRARGLHPLPADTIQELLDGRKGSCNNDCIPRSIEMPLGGARCWRNFDMQVSPIGLLARRSRLEALLADAPHRL